MADDWPEGAPGLNSDERIEDDQLDRISVYVDSLEEAYGMSRVPTDVVERLEEALRGMEPGSLSVLFLEAGRHGIPNIRSGRFQKRHLDWILGAIFAASC